jgi:hypothetical protein
MLREQRKTLCENALQFVEQAGRRDKVEVSLYTKYTRG